MKEVYFIGGSSFSQKREIAEVICQKNGFIHYTIDENIERYLERGIIDNKRLLSIIQTLHPDSILLRDSTEQLIMLYQVYCELFSYVLEDIVKLSNIAPVIAEDSGLLPELMNKAGISNTRYVCIIPQNIGQHKRCALNGWFASIYKKCTNKKEAIINWLDCERKFAELIAKKSCELCYETIVMSNNATLNEQIHTIETALNLGSTNTKKEYQWT